MFYTFRYLYRPTNRQRAIDMFRYQISDYNNRYKSYSSPHKKIPLVFNGIRLNRFRDIQLFVLLRRRVDFDMFFRIALILDTVQ